MSNLSPSIPAVQPRAAESWPSWTDQESWTLPDISHEDPYVPSLEDLAFETGRTVGLADGRFRMPDLWHHDGRGLRFAMGRQAGQKDRERAEAYGLGETLGYREGASEPPAGYRDHEATAFRTGYAAGLARWEQERAEDAYYDERALDRLEDAFTDPADHEGVGYAAGFTS